MYAARIRGCESNMTVAVYQGDNAEGEWFEDISRCTRVRHPNVVQLFGTATSSGLHVGIFHDQLIPCMHFFENSRRSPVWSVYFWGFMENEFFEAVHYINNLFGYHDWPVNYILWIRPSTGRLCVDLAGDGDCGPIIFLNFLHGDGTGQPLLESGEDSQVIASMSMKWYHYICRIHLSETSTFPIPTHSGGRKTINCHLARLSISFNFDDPTFECGWYFRSDTAVMMENGWTRIESSAIRNQEVFRLMISLDDPRPCEAWLAQANHIFNRLNVTSDYKDYVLVTDIQYRLSLSRRTDNLLPGYLFLCPLPEFQLGAPSRLIIPDCVAYWSRDPLGAKRLSLGEAEDLGFPRIEIEGEFMGHSWSNDVYQGLHDFHEGKGFDPCGLDIARYLQLPLFRISEALEVSACGADEGNNIGREEEPPNLNEFDLFVAEASMSRNQEMGTPYQSGDIIFAVQLALILTLGACWLYNYVRGM
ncbi:hypothetical protein K438DRAFT_1862811 [Mycena galopus ATCC 62051]|nr:hypothetical protein K438DRAFT_1862811 [Mycena galopus ATCC 62051]